MRTRTYPQRPDTRTPDTHTSAAASAHPSAAKRRVVRAAVVAGALGAASLVGTVTATSASAASATTHAGITGWTQVTHYLEGTLGAGEGVTTVYPPGGSSSVLYRGVSSIPAGVAAEGWSHIGDPDSTQGYVFDNFQSGASSPTSKMFRVTTPSGSSYEYVHQLVSGEEYNNSWDAVSPDTQWMLAGEWDTMTHLQIYPTPILNHQTSPTGGSLALSGYVQLDHAVNDVQGCDFVTATKLICASDDNSQTLFPEQKPLLEVDLANPVTGGDVAGHVVDLGPIPQTNSICSGTFESEGVDYDVNTGILRVEIIQPSICAIVTTIYEYKAS